MRSVRISGIILSLVLLLHVGIAEGRAPFTFNPIPDSLEEIFQMLYGEGDDGSDIEQYMSEAMCGGWNLNLHVSEKDAEAGKPGLIARVFGFPGRRYKPLEDMSTGVAQPITKGGALDDGFYFPENTTGMSTVCRPHVVTHDPETGRPAVKHSVWDDTAEGRNEKWIPYPYFEDPPCLWEGDTNPPNFSKQGPPPHSPQKCANFCTWLNSFTYQDCPPENIIRIDPPKVIDDAYKTLVDIPLTIPPPGILGNDSDPQGMPISAFLVTPPPAGAVVLNIDGSFMYTPPPGFVGKEEFLYMASNGLTNSLITKVTITVEKKQLPDAPVAIDDFYRGLKAGTLSLPPPGILANDRDPQGKPLTALLIAGPSGGDLTLRLDGSLEYKGNANYIGQDEFSYVASNGVANSNVARVRVQEEGMGAAAINPAFLTAQLLPDPLPPTNPPLPPSSPPSPLPSPPSSPPGKSKYMCKPDGWKPYPVCTWEPPSLAPPAPNCKVCTGEACRCPGPGCERAPISNMEYASYEREYSGGEERNPHPDVPTDIAAMDIRGVCYGFYNEFSIDQRKTNSRDWNCSLYAPRAGELFQSQTGKGTETATDAADPQNPLSEEEMRRLPPPAATDPYIPFSGAFTLFNDAAVLEQEGNLSTIVLNAMADIARERSTKQLPSRAFAQSNTTRPFDDSGIQTLVHWWQKQRTMMQYVLRRSAVYVLLPPQNTLGVDTSKPPFTPDESPSTSNIDPASLPIRVQLQVGDDLLSSVLHVMQVHIEEVPIHFPLYTSSVAEIIAMRRAWCQRIMQETKQRTCTEGNIPAPVQELMQAFDDYEAYMARTPILRSVLAQHIGNILRVQNEIAAPVIDVLKQHLDTYRTLIREQAILIGSLTPLWRQAEQTYTTFHEKTNLPYCYNGRYTAAIKSLIDEVLPARNEDGDVHEKGKLVENQLVTLVGLAEQSHDIVIDLTRIPRMKKRLKLYTLKPFWDRIDLPEPPDVATPLAHVKVKLPVLPDLDRIIAAMETALDELPTVDTSHVTPPDIDFPEPLGAETIAEAQRRLREINQVLQRLNSSYEYYWHSIFAFAGNPRYPQPTCTVNGAEVPLQPLELCDTRKIPALPEMDLVPMIGRGYGARPMVNLIEDYQSNTWPRHYPAVCLPWSPGCSSMPAETSPVPTEWEALGPASTGEQTTNKLRQDIFNETLLPPVGELPAHPPLDHPYQEIIQSLGESQTTNLTPHP